MSSTTIQNLLSALLIIISLYEDRFLIAFRFSGVMFTRGRVGLRPMIRLSPSSFVFLTFLIVKVDFSLNEWRVRIA